MSLEALYGRAFPALDSSDWSSLGRFQQLVSGAGKLTGFAAEQIPEQIARSLLLTKLLRRSNRVLDVGSGAGFPGIPLALTLGRAWLIEPRRSAVAFLERVGRELNLEIVVIELSAEEAGRGHWRESFDVVIARALAPPPVAFELLAPLCGPGGRVVVTGSPNGLRDPPPLFRSGAGQLSNGDFGIGT